MAELTRRELLKAGGATAAVAGIVAFRGPAVSAKPPPGAWNHDPASPIGPYHWGDIGFPVCGTGANQSPVNIATDSLAVYHGPPLVLRYEPSELGVENTGHVVEVMTPADVTSGSLTTPGCTEGVIWSVLADGGGVSQAAVARFHQVIARFPTTTATRTTTARCCPSTAGSSSSAAAGRTTN